MGDAGAGMRAGRAEEVVGTWSKSWRADSFPSHRRAAGFQVISPTTVYQHCTRDCQGYDDDGEARVRGVLLGG